MKRVVRLFGAFALVISVLGSAVGVSYAATNHAKKSLSVMSINPSPGFGLDWTLGQRGFFQRIDASGGIDGHQVTFSTCSDGTFIAQSQDMAYTCAQQAVSSGVFAVTGSISNYDNVVYPVLQAANIPDIGTFPSTPIDYTSKESMPFLSPQIVLNAGLAIQLKQQGHCSNIAFIDQAGTAITQASDDSFKAGGKYAGVKVSPAQDISATTTDFAPTIAILDGQGVDCLGFGLSQGDLPGLLTAIQDSGHPMKVTFVAANVSSSTLQAVGPNANGLMADLAGQYDAQVSNFNPPKATPGEKQLLQDFARFPASLQTSAIDYPGWQAADAFYLGVKQVDKEHLPLTSKNLGKVMNDMPIHTGVFLDADFATKGPIPGYPRVHDTDVNWIVVKNLQYVPYDYTLHPVGPALAHFKG
jgi:ABC-type branched-subunit amino acid transport system substrate-binding protein